jgi:dolichyl-phosphate beta-glucosyltransferase
MIATVVDVLSLYAFVDLLRIPLLLSTAFSFFLAVVVSFTLNKYWTFQNKSSNIRKQFIKFLIVSGIGLALTESSMALLVFGLGIWYVASKLLTSGIVLTWNFLANRFWTFKDRIFYVPAAMHSDYELSIIVPAFNEERRIRQTLESVDRYCSDRGITREIIVVDDGSSDGTRQLVEELRQEIRDLSVISYRPNRGKGFAVKAGVEASRGEFVLFTDADNSTPIEEFDKVRPLLREHPVVIGSRYISESRIVVTQPPLRVWIGRLGNRTIQLFLLDGINDTQCGFKAFQREAARQIFGRMKVMRFGFDIELLSIARLLNLSIREVPVSWYNSPESRIRPLKDAIRTFGELVYIKLNLWGGRYR